MISDVNDETLRLYEDQIKIYSGFLNRFIEGSEYRFDVGSCLSKYWWCREKLGDEEDISLAETTWVRKCPECKLDSLEDVNPRVDYLDAEIPSFE